MMDLRVLDVTAEGLELDDRELAEIAHSLPPPTTARNHAASALCWGGCLAGDHSQCSTLELGDAPSKHFKHKLCAHCQWHGFCVPVERVRAIPPSLHATFANSPSLSAWSVVTHQSGGPVYFRTINQTRKCHGTWLVVFQAQPPDDLPWAPLPPESVREGRIWLRHSKGTLVPDLSIATLPPSTLPLPNGLELDAQAPKRGLEGSIDDAGSHPKLRRECSRPSPTDASAEEDGEALPLPPLERLLALHVALQREIDRVLQGDALEACLAAVEPANVSPSTPSDSPGASRTISPLSPASPASTRGALSDDQRAALEELQGPLCRSAAALRREGSADAQPVGVDPASWLGWFTSNPPSPPGSSGRGSARVGRWSSHLCACLSDPMSCACTFFCWPIMAGQLGQKIVGARSMCLCFAIPMLVFAIVQVRFTFLRVLGESSLVSPKLELELRPRLGLLGAVGNRTIVRGAGDSPESTSSQTLGFICIWLIGFCCGISVLWDTMLRTLVRQRDAIPGSPLRDLCTSIWTSCCCLSLCQLARHEGLVGERYGVLSPTGEKPRAQVADMLAV